MTQKTISDHPDGKSIRLSTAQIRFEQAGVTYRDTFRPNPANTLYVTNQAQLEAELGTDLIIPTGESRIIIIDESFTLDKPFKKQADSSLLIRGPSITVTLTYTGSGALIQMDGAVIGAITQVEDITLKGAFDNEAFAIEDSIFFIIKRVPITEFARVGYLKGMTILWDESGPFTNLSGIAFINNPAISITTTGPNGQSVPSTTAMSFISVAKSDIVFENNVYLANTSLHEFIFIDPNTDQSSSFKIRDSGVITTVTESLFQKGVDVAVTAVVDNGSGKIRCTATAHGQVNKTYAVLSGFLTETSYNKTALITVIDGNTFDAEEIDFTAGDTGNINRSSLDSRDPRVIAEDNPEQRDSMFTGEAGLELFGSEITSSSLAQNASEVISSPSWMFTKLERFVVGTANDGQLQCKDLSNREYNIKYSATIEKSGGGSLNIGIILLKNGIDVSFNPPHTVNTGKIQISANDVVELGEDDTIQVAVINYDASATAIDISQTSLVISKG